MHTALSGPRPPLPMIGSGVERPPPSELMTGPRARSLILTVIVLLCSAVLTLGIVILFR